MTRVAIIGFPRTGTTKIYVELSARLSEGLKIFEPFNPEPHALCLGGKPLHDIEGRVECNTCSRDRELARLVLRNSLWLVRYIRSDDLQAEPVLGVHAEEIVEKVLSYKHFLLKDGCLWLRHDLVEKLLREDVLVVMPIRDLRSLYAAFMQWYKTMCGPYWRCRRVVAGVLRRNVKAIKRGIVAPDQCRKRWLFGLGVFYRILRGREPTTLLEALVESYRAYIRRALELARRYPNAVLLWYRERLSDADLAELVKIVFH